ncbi:MAG: hypothetical protein NTV30_11020, partial [Chloroflexi bacterium]|nr:hypothetical protein [Chloroflexota bacterium]
FVKAFGATFLARPRSGEVQHAKESPIFLCVGMGALALATLLFGLFSGYVAASLEKIGRDFSIFRNIPSFTSISPARGLAVGNFAFISVPALFVIFLVVFVIVWLATKYIINKGQKVRTGATWDCGTDLTPRMEITSTGFARSIIVIFKGILKPSMQHKIEYSDAKSRYLPKSRRINLSASDLHLSYFYKPLGRIVTLLSERMKNIQTGNVNAYILYIFIALLIALFLVK